jgi:hypothetical protein
MSKPSAPAAPDPNVTAAAQQQLTSENIRQLAQTNRINQYGPNQNVTYTQDPNNPDSWSQTTTLNPQLQANLDAQNWNQGALQNLGTQGLQGLTSSGTFGRGLDMGAVNPLTSSAGPTGVVTGIDGTKLPGIQTGLNTNFGDLAQQAQDATYKSYASRLDPQWQQSDEALQSQLANQGITPGSTAYNNAMDTQARARNDAYSQANQNAVMQGNQEQNQLFNQSAQAGAFGNTAAGQAFQQALGQAGFTNQALGQQFGQNLNNAQLGNQANQLGIQNQETAQNFPLSQIMSVLTGASPYQPTQTGVAQITPSGVPDYGSMVGQQYQGQLNAYNGAVGSANNTTSAVGTIAAAAMMYF